MGTSKDFLTTEKLLWKWKVNCFPGRYHLPKHHDVTQPVGSDQAFFVFDGLNRDWAILSLANQVSDARMIELFDLASVSQNDFLPTLAALRSFGVLRIIANEEDATQQAQFERN